MRVPTCGRFARTHEVVNVGLALANCPFTTMTEPRIHNVLIIGSGPAGLTAAIYAARANLKPLCVEGFNAGGLIPGGQLMFTSNVENYPGFAKSVSGQELMTAFREQAIHQGTEIITADVQKVDLSSRPFKVWVGEDENILHLARTVIVATGARANYIGLESEDKLKNKGVARVCGLRRRALSRPQRRGRRRRRFGDGRGVVPCGSLQRRDAHPPPRRVPRLEGHGGPREKEPEDPHPLQPRRRGSARRRTRTW